MAQFIELPYGVYNINTKHNERTAILVNVNNIISIEPYEELMCKVVVHGGKSITVWRRFDTLSAQIRNKDVEPAILAHEELMAAYAQGYAKGRDENAPNEKAEKKRVKAQLGIMREWVKAWMEVNPMGTNWRNRFDQDWKVKVESLGIDGTTEAE